MSSRVSDKPYTLPPHRGCSFHLFFLVRVKDVHRGRSRGDHRLRTFPHCAVSDHGQHRGECLELIYSWIQECVSVNPRLLIYPFPALSLLVIRSLFSMSWVYFCLVNKFIYQYSLFKKGLNWNTGKRGETYGIILSQIRRMVLNILCITITWIAAVIIDSPTL